MKNRPLAFQIWIVFAGILLLISVILAVLFPMIIRQFFTTEIYTTIESEQQVLTESRFPQEEGDKRLQEQFGAPDRSVRHILLPLDASVIFYSGPLPNAFIAKSREEALEQNDVSARYSSYVEEERIFYVIRKVKADNQPAYLLSYVEDSYLDNLTFTLFRQLGLLMLLVFVLSWIPSLVLAKYLSKPLVHLQRHVKRLSKQEWNDPVDVHRKDEIGDLGHSIEDMRQKLVAKDEAQRTLLQNISHDLKTPVMVIRGYAQSVSDGVFPKGDLSSTMAVVEQESEKLEKKIKNILYLTKLDYLSRRELPVEHIQLDRLIEDVTERLRWTRQEVEIQSRLQAVSIEGDTEQWVNLLENVLENQLRYAKEELAIELFEQKGNAILIVANDGPQLEDEEAKRLFEPFHKGKEGGQTGIGLSIVHRILSLHHGNITIENQAETGVFYRIVVPKVRQSQSLPPKKN
ncbi:HAMP domain-containing histidine kinase [Bacillaceae bacterium SIJ1]|uniref:sensor histidine kinase n=1 Tax=Litoribacterium kuwaitense TaxID=1398745 RepID=UPI0013EAB735|nr:HAMP domain-containing sensor histidine kinase [Litoribacterium kuwaitense]NGP46267.1 HAMP domain-containing histidine kinase [Litoribacterium kuwaitense]